MNPTQPPVNLADFDLIVSNDQMPVGDVPGGNATEVVAGLAARVGELAGMLDAELVAFRRDVHAHPELSRKETRTTRVVAERLQAAGLEPRLLPIGSGLVCDIGPDHGPDGEGRVGLRADLDALPLQETSGVEFASTEPGVAHACGHDVHTTVVLGAGLVLARLAEEGRLRRGVRLFFQPAEEVFPGGAEDIINRTSELDGVDRMAALHCDPKFDVGHVGTRIGPITSASDSVMVTVSSPGGHTSRPHLTGDVVFALGQVITQTPGVLGRRLDPRSGVNLTWGAVQAGSTPNAIPSTGVVKGTLRCLDVRAWEKAGELVRDAVEQIVAPYQVTVAVTVTHGVPPVENQAAATCDLEDAVRDAVGPDAVQLTEQSMGGEDFAWFLRKVPGTMARLGVRTPGGRTYDLHQGDLVVDERAIGVGVRTLAQFAAS
ncbi:amidohydrolase [Promicromonospora umidemergens]|uniref:M20 family metallopeptidase n=2 Tax=Promicromonospora umidemergens TaxID=629679 RepID=A0ABP8Y266_9MICO|nr:amidohydrolase [Promicromonospora umidemergens]